MNSMEYKLSKYLFITDVSVNNTDDQRLVYSTRTGEVVLLNSTTISNIKNGNFSFLEEDIIDKLIFSEIIIPEFEDELETILNEFEISKSDDNSLGMVITPSANCQLGCSYCGQTHSKLNITQDLSSKIFNHIKKKLSLKKYSNLDIVWYGAEPLMGINSIRILSNQLIELCKEKNISYSASMITNGLNLNEKNFEDLVCNMKVKSFQITIDGIRETHDNSRYTKKGKPTFDIIMNNVYNAVNNPLYLKENALITIRVNVHKENYLDVEKLLEYFTSLKIQDKILMSFAPVHDWGNNNADKEVGLSLEDFSTLEIDWFLKMKELNYRNQNLIPSRIYGTCMTTTNDSELIDAKGEVSYCWEVPYTPDFENNKELIIGNVSEKDLHLKDTINMPLRNWYEDIKNKKHNSENCNSCEFLPICGGQCPVSWFKGVRACPSFKVNMEDRLILQYLNEKKLLT